MKIGFFYIACLGIFIASCNSINFTDLDRDNPCDLKGDNPQITGSPIPNFSYQANGFKVDFINNSTNADNFEWNFGIAGETVSNVNPTYYYPAFNGVSNYTVSLSASNLCESVTITRSIILNCPNAPQAYFTYSLNGLSVSFQNFSVNAQNVNWNFGDGTQSTDFSPTHDYATYGTFNVELRVSNDDCGEVFITLPLVIANCDPLPLPQFNVTTADDLTIVTSNLSQNALYYSWNFGDGYTSIEANPVHTYTKSGTYTIVLSASNLCAAQVTSQQVTICISVLLDSRNGNSYKIVKMGNQCWMAENLNFGTQKNSLIYGGIGPITEFCAGDLHPDLPVDNNQTEKYCLENEALNCNLNGGLYTWNEAMNVGQTPGSAKGICPEGWHVPSDEEWKILESNLGIDPNTLNQEGYRGSNQALILADQNGFNAEFCGYRNYDGDFNFANSIVVFWTSTESSDPCKSWIRYIASNSGGIYRSTDVGDKNYGYCVRCIND
ncbi:PKD domain-containing protein [Sphingobacteriales bacterium UPWRP_1]|nr:hypothetical protein BVG80_07625 [Sphingobacteriales bacterium TSM_CSM]PSJ76116.1 PKD domain-containing protein [Sphingobacteriales bacterium UPWRP_1]